MSCFYGLCVYIKMENQTLAGRVVNGHVFKEKKIRIVRLIQLIWYINCNTHKHTNKVYMKKLNNEIECVQKNPKPNWTDINVSN